MADAEQPDSMTGRFDTAGKQRSSVGPIACFDRHLEGNGS